MPEVQCMDPFLTKCRVTQAKLKASKNCQFYWSFHLLKGLSFCALSLSGGETMYLSMHCHICHSLSTTYHPSPHQEWPFTLIQYIVFPLVLPNVRFRLENWYSLKELVNCLHLLILDLCYKLSCSLHLVSIDLHGSLVSTGACLPHFVCTRVSYVHRHTDTHNVHTFTFTFCCIQFKCVSTGTRTTYVRSNVAQTTMLCIPSSTVYPVLKKYWLLRAPIDFPCKEKVPKVVVKLCYIVTYVGCNSIIAAV